MRFTRDWHEFAFRVKTCVRDPTWCISRLIVALWAGGGAPPIGPPPNVWWQVPIVFVANMVMFTVMGGLMGAMAVDAVDRGEFHRSGPRGRLE